MRIEKAKRIHRKFEYIKSLVIPLMIKYHNNVAIGREKIDERLSNDIPWYLTIKTKTETDLSEDYFSAIGLTDNLKDNIYCCAPVSILEKDYTTMENL